MNWGMQYMRFELRCLCVVIYLPVSHDQTSTQVRWLWGYMFCLPKTNKHQLPQDFFPYYNILQAATQQTGKHGSIARMFSTEQLAHEWLGSIDSSRLSLYFPKSSTRTIALHELTR
ncbi:uncharacterized protein LY89DRAFT_680650, partial [Mollisia scopiformis]